MKELWRYLRRYRVQCVLAPLFKMLEASFELMVPLVMKRIVDEALGHENAPLLAQLVGLMVALGLVGLVSSVTAQYFSARAATGFAGGVRTALFQKVQSLSFSDMDQLGTPALIARMTGDVNQAQTGVNMTLRLFLRSPFVVFGAMIMAFTIDVRCALIFVAVIAALLIVVSVIMAVNIPMMRGVQQALEDVLGATRENLTGARVIRAFGNEDRQFEAFRQKNRLLVARQSRAGRISGLMNPLTYVLINLGIVWLIHTGAVRVSTGTLTGGDVVALYNYMSQILVELIKLANLIVTMNRAWACWTRVSDVLRREPGMTAPGDGREAAAADAVRFENVCLSYSSTGDEALTDITFSVPKGTVLGIVGSTGSGKSSVVRLIDRFYDATSGRVLVDGVDVKDWNLEKLRGRIGYVLQKAVLFKGSIRFNLLWGDETATDEQLLEAVRAAQAEDVVRAKGGLDGLIEQEGRNLSGGQRQRLTIARALARRPEILILDDSMSALDQATDLRLRRALKTLSYRPTVIIVSQRAASIRHADQILVLEDGRMAGLGTHEALLETCEVYKEICETSLGGEVGA